VKYYIVRCKYDGSVAWAQTTIAKAVRYAEAYPGKCPARGRLWTLEEHEVPVTRETVRQLLQGGPAATRIRTLDIVPPMKRGAGKTPPSGA
jgi:hypothetical protein